MDHIPIKPVAALAMEAYTCSRYGASAMRQHCHRWQRWSASCQHAKACKGSRMAVLIRPRCLLNGQNTVMAPVEHWQTTTHYSCTTIPHTHHLHHQASSPHQLCLIYNYIHYDIGITSRTTAHSRITAPAAEGDAATHVWEGVARVPPALHSPIAKHDK
jgi:hypothetical protein